MRAALKLLQPVKAHAPAAVPANPAAQPFDVAAAQRRLLKQRYRVLEKLGEGSFADVVKARDMVGNREVALKVMRKSCEEIGKNEARNLQAICDARGFERASYVARYLDEFTYEGHFVIVMELGVPLAALPAGPWPLAKLRKLALQLMLALMQFGAAGMIHADLKPDNLVLRRAPGADWPSTSVGVQLVDLGNAMRVEFAAEYVRRGRFDVQTLPFRAPEVLMGLPFGPAIDAWSAGCVLVGLCLQRRLFDVLAEAALCSRMRALSGEPFAPAVFGRGARFAEFCAPATGEPLGSAAGDAGPSLRELLHDRDALFVDFCEGLLRLEPAARLTPRDALEHPFLSGLFPFGAIAPSSGPAPVAPVLDTAPSPTAPAASPQSAPVSPPRSPQSPQSPQSAAGSPQAAVEAVSEEPPAKRRVVVPPEPRSLPRRKRGMAARPFWEAAVPAGAEGGAGAGSAPAPAPSPAPAPAAAQGKRKEKKEKKKKAHKAKRRKTDETGLGAVAASLPSPGEEDGGDDVDGDDTESEWDG